MTEETKTFRAAKTIAAAVKNPLALTPYAVAVELVAAGQQVSTDTARKYVRAAVSEGLLLEIKPDPDWSILLPEKDAELGLFVLHVNRDQGNLVTTEKPRGRQAGSLNTFVVTLEQAGEIVRIYAAEWQAQQAKKEAEYEAKLQAERAEAVETDADLVSVLDRLAAALTSGESCVRPLVLRRGGIRTMLEIDKLDADIFKEIIRAGLDVLSQPPAEQE